LLALTASVGAEQVSVRPRSIDLGTVPVGLRVESKITLVNNTAEAVEVRLSAGEPFSMPVESLTIEKGSEREIAIAFAAGKPGVYRSEISVEVEQLFGSEGLAVPVTATAARPGLVLDPLEIEFDSVAVGASARRTLLLSNSGQVPLQIDSIYLAGRTGSFAVLPPDQRSLEPGASVEVTLVFTPPADGLVVDRLVIESPETVPARVEVGRWRGVGRGRRGLPPAGSRPRFRPSRDRPAEQRRGHRSQPWPRPPRGLGSRPVGRELLSFCGQ
jgi:hypothetical protein